MTKRYTKLYLASHREGHNLSQGNLATETMLSLKTIQRAEKSGIASRRTVDKISSVLGIQIDDLKHPYVEGEASKSTDRDTSASRDSGSYIKRSFSIRSGSSEALGRTSERYGVKQSAIVDLAPALFTLVAEISLAKRKDVVEEISSDLGANDFLSTITKKAAHLDGFFGVSEIYLMNGIDAEETSIEQLDIRCLSEVFDMNWGYGDDPFVAMLNELASDITDETLGAFEQDVDDRISFRCCEGKRELEIRGEFEEHPEWAQHVIDGEITHGVAKEALKKDSPAIILAALFENLTPSERQSLTDEISKDRSEGGEDGQ